MTLPRIDPEQPATATVPVIRLCRCMFLLGAALLANACGGGASPVTSVASPFTLGGTVAVGAPVGGASVQVKCSDGASGVVSMTTVSSSVGAYSVQLLGAVAPCLLQAGTLFGYANASGTANLTPLTTAVLAAALGVQDLTGTFSAFNASGVQSLTSTIHAGSMDTAWSRLRALLQAGALGAASVSTTAISTNPFSHDFQADSAHQGTGHDRVLDDLAAAGLQATQLFALASGTPVAPLGATGKLNDTGIDWCRENFSSPGNWVFHAICTAINRAGNLWVEQQDGWMGRDAGAQAGTLQKVGTGMAGFDFSRLGNDSTPLAVQNSTWSATGNEAAGTLWDCVRDNVTGLVWEVKRDDPNHLRASSHTFGWYNPEASSNGGSAGFSSNADTGAACTGVADTDQCNTQSYVAAVNAAGLCGKSDWRLPTINELQTLSHLGVVDPALDAQHFPNTPVASFWSSSTVASYADGAWGVYAGDGRDMSADKIVAHHVRLVRSGR